MHRVDETWDLKAVRLPSGKWITLGIMQDAEGWHRVWWQRHDEHDDIIRSKVDGGSDPYAAEASKDAARSAALVDARAQLP